MNAKTEKKPKHPDRRRETIAHLRRQIGNRERRGWAYARERVRCLPDPAGANSPKPEAPAGDGRTCVIDGECVPMPDWVRDAIDPTGPEWRTVRLESD